MVSFIFVWLFHPHILITNEFLSLLLEYCSIDFSQVSYEDVKVAFLAHANQRAYPASCIPFNNKACQYKVEVNNFGNMCSMLFINYLGIIGPYSTGYFIGSFFSWLQGQMYLSLEHLLTNVLCVAIVHIVNR